MAKNYFVFFFLVFFLLSSLALADVMYEETGRKDMDVNYDRYVEKPLFSWLQPFTTVGGALCASNPSWYAESVINTEQICWNNNNGGSPGGTGVKHTGVAYQVWKLPEWDNVHCSGTLCHSVGNYVNVELQIPAGQTGCFTLPVKGAVYHRAAWFCDEISRSCSDDTSVCHTETETKRVRYCSDTGREEVWVDWVDYTVGYCAGYVPPTPVPPIVDPVTPPPPPPPPPPIGLAGSFSSIVVPTNVNPEELFTVKAVFTAEKTGTYLLEAGMVESPTALAAVTIPAGSKCDGDKHWSGDFFQLTAGQAIELEWTAQARTEPGTYQVVIGAYSGCLKDGGKSVALESKYVNVLGAKAGLGSLWFYGLIGLILFAIIYVWRKVK